MIDPDTLYFSSEEYRFLLDSISDSITAEGIEQRNRNPIDACKHGHRVWEHLLELMKMLQAKSVYEIDQRQATIYDLLAWASEYADTLHSASMKDNSYISKKLEFCEKYLEMHDSMLDRDVRNLGNIRVSLAETYYQVGRSSEADALFREWLSAEPDWGWGWIGWSDCYWLWNIPNMKKDFNKAKMILEEGLSVPQVLDIDYMKERYSDLRKKKQSYQ